MDRVWGKEARGKDAQSRPKGEERFHIGFGQKGQSQGHKKRYLREGGEDLK